MNIYNPIPPTYLYIKQHSITGLKYFGKTTRDPYKYLGSGKYWLHHIRKHGKEFVNTIWVSEPYTNATILTEFALFFSEEYDIVNSKVWANLIPENGLDGGPTNIGKKLPPKSASTRKKISDAHKGKKQSAETIAKRVFANTGKKQPVRSPEVRAKLSAAKKGKKATPESIAINSASKKGKQHSAEHNAAVSRSLIGVPKRKVICPHCGKSGGTGNMSRWHFDNCKMKHISSNTHIKLIDEFKLPTPS